MHCVSYPEARRNPQNCSVPRRKFVWHGAGTLAPLIFFPSGFCSAAFDRTNMLRVLCVASFVAFFLLQCVCGSTPGPYRKMHPVVAETIQNQIKQLQNADQQNKIQEEVKVAALPRFSESLKTQLLNCGDDQHFSCHVEQRVCPSVFRTPVSLVGGTDRKTLGVGS